MPPRSPEAPGVSVSVATREPTTWWTTSLPGRNSIAWIHRGSGSISSVIITAFRLMFRSLTSSSTQNGSARSSTRSGSPISQPAGHSIASGAFAGSPRRAPVLAQPTIVSISSAVRTRSFVNCPCVWSLANQGGMSFASTCRAMLRAHGRVSS